MSWPINCCTSPIMHKITPSVDYNKWLKRLDTQPNEPTNSIKIPKVVRPQISKLHYKTLGTNVTNSTLFPLSLKPKSRY